MTRLPSFQFYPGDWRNNIKLRRCSPAALGAWINILCVLHDQEEYGVVRWPLAELARIANVPLKLARQLVAKGVLKGSDTGLTEPFVFQPYHAGVHGVGVTLIASCPQNIWFSSRMVVDEYRRKHRGKNTRFSSENQPPCRSPSRSPTRRQDDGEGERQGDGPSSSSSASPSKIRDNPDRPVGVRSEKRATRWPADAVIPDDWFAAAATRRSTEGLLPVNLTLQAELFTNYWASKSGKDATKHDWKRTWINWVLNAKGDSNGRGRGSKSETELAGARAAAQFFAQGGASEGSADSGDVVPPHPALPSH